MTAKFMDFPQNLSDHMPEKSDPIAHNGKQNLLWYGSEWPYWQNKLIPGFVLSSKSANSRNDIQ